MFFHLSKSYVFLALMLVTLPFVTARPKAASQDEVGKAYREANKLIIDEKWTEAIKALQDVLKKFPASDWSDDAQFWICFATEKTESALEKTFDCYNRFIQANPKSEWANDARMNMVRLAEALAKEGKPQYQERVRSFGNTSDNEIEMTVLMTLLEIGDEGSVTKVLDRLDRISNEEVRGRVVRMLGDRPMSPTVLRKVTDVARKDRSVRVRQSALRALAESKNPEALAIVRDIALTDESVEVRRYALRRLGESRGADAENLALLKKVALTDPNDAVKESAVLGLGELRGTDAVGALTELYTESKSKEVRRAVVRVMADRKQEQSQVLAFLLRVASADAEPDVRRTAILSIGELKTPEGSEKLKEIATNSSLDAETRETAIRAIAEDRRDAALDVLTALLKSEKDARLRRRVVAVLGEYKKDSIVPILAGVAKTDANIDVRKAAVRALGEIGTAAAREALEKILLEIK